MTGLSQWSLFITIWFWCISICCNTSVENTPRQWENIITAVMRTEKRGPCVISVNYKGNHIITITVLRLRRIPADNNIKDSLWHIRVYMITKYNVPDNHTCLWIYSQFSLYHILLGRYDNIVQPMFMAMNTTLSLKIQDKCNVNKYVIIIAVCEATNQRMSWCH